MLREQPAQDAHSSSIAEQAELGSISTEIILSDVCDSAPSDILTMQNKPHQTVSIHDMCLHF
jgi:hypothetical protein